MDRFSGYLVPIILMLFSAYSQGQTIDTFPFEEPGGGVSALQIGPEGDIWFTRTNPLRLMRISNDTIECVYDSRIMNTEVCDITIAPDGTIYLSGVTYMYSPETGFSKTNIRMPWDGILYSIIDIPAILDADMRIYCMWHTCYPYTPNPYDDPEQIWEIVPGGDPVFRFSPSYRKLESPLIVSINECWVINDIPHDTFSLLRVDLLTGMQRCVIGCDWTVNEWGVPEAKDEDGTIWLGGAGIFTLKGDDLSVFAEGQGYDLAYGGLLLAADGVVWATRFSEDYTVAEVVRFDKGPPRVFGASDGLLSDQSYSAMIDYDGGAWVFNTAGYRGDILGFSRISDGGWPPMRLMLHRLETPEGAIAVEAQVINNGPVVGVDVYVALEMNGQLLFWPNWQPAPCPVQLNLRPGHNQTATIISAPRSSIPPGSYTFWGCMTGRNTQKLIGPLDRKFESLTIEVGDRQ